MVLFKEKKNKKEKKKKKIKTTLDYKHSEIMNEINSKKTEIPGMEKRKETLEKKLKEYNKNPTNKLTEEELEDKMMIKDEIEQLNEKISLLKSNRELDNYLLDTSLMLYDYFDEDNNCSVVKKSQKNSKQRKTVLDFFSNNQEKEKNKKNDEPKENKSDTDNLKYKSSYRNKKEILESYFSIVDTSYIPSNGLITNIDIDSCVTCNESRIFDSVHGIYICPKCGCEEKILVDSDTPSYKEPPREITYFAYKKINHANEFLSQFQAKESTDIPLEIFEKIQEELKKESYLNYKNVSPVKVREVLKKLELTKYYEHCHYICNRLTGKPAPTLTPELEDKLRNMFKEVQAPWINYCPNDRANFFSYPYIFFKFFQLLDKDEYLPYCRLLKSREKLQEHDEVWKKICRDLRWQYIPTV